MYCFFFYCFAVTKYISDAFLLDLVFRVRSQWYSSVKLVHLSKQLHTSACEMFSEEVGLQMVHEDVEAFNSINIWNKYVSAFVRAFVQVCVRRAELLR